MIIKIQTRDGSGKYINVCASDFIKAALDHASCEWGWVFLRMWIGRWCILRAESFSENRTEADLWYRRYQAIRGIE